jgi:arsenite methyltransferase
MFRKIIESHFRKPKGLIGMFTSKMMIKGNMANYHVLLKDLDVQPDDKIMEIGYGPGKGIELISNISDSCHIYGIDFSTLMHKKASKLNKLLISDGQVKLFTGDFMRTEIGEYDFDKIFCINVVYFWNTLQPPFEKIRSLLKEGGFFHFFMAHRDFLLKMKASDDIFSKHTIKEVVTALRLSGFKEIDYTFNKGYYIKARK